MSIQKVVQTQRDFSAGELDPRAARRDDTKIMRAGLRHCRNMLPTPTGPLSRRPGNWMRWIGAGRIGEMRPTPTRPFWIEFLGGAFRARPADSPRVIHSEITGCPWTEDDLDKLDWSSAGTTMLVTHHDGTMVPQVLEYNIAADTWSRADFSFDLSFQGEKRQPYHRFPETLGITMSASGRTGSVTVTFSDDVLVSAQAEAYPQVEATADSEVASAFSTFNLPAGIQAGELLIAIISVRRITGLSGYPNITTGPSGWTLLRTRANDRARMMVYARIADGLEGATASLTLNTNAVGAATVYRLSGTFDGDLPNTVYVSDSVADEGINPDPPLTTTPWALAPTLWIAAAVRQSASQMLAPANSYTLVTAPVIAGDNAIRLVTATRELTATEENPAQFTGPTSTVPWIAMTIAVLAATQPVAGHVGARFLYVDKEVEITAITSPTQGTANVIDTLPPSQPLTSESGASQNFAAFSVGEVVEGENSGARGEIVSKASSTSITVQLYNQQNGFQNSEKIIGPKATAILTSSGAGSLGNPGAIVNWKEELMNDLRGWPGSVTMDRQRAIFTRMRQFPQAIMWSAIRTIGNFAVTEEPDSAIFEYVPGDVSVEMVMGGPDQFVLTDKGVYYIPISESSPLMPGSVAFRLVSPDSSSNIRPVWTPDGMVFVSRPQAQENTVGRLLSMTPTGQTAQPYVVRDLSRYHSHLLTSPRAMAVVDPGMASPERMIWLVMDDGTAVAVRYNPEEEWVGWYPHEMHGLARGMTALGQRLMFRVEHDLTLDAGEGEEGEGEEGVDAPENMAAEELSADHRLDTSILVDRTDLLMTFAGHTLDLYGADRYLGQVTIGDDGSVPQPGEDPIPGDAYVGFIFTPAATPFTPNVGEGESVQQRMRRRKISKALITVYESTGFNIGTKVIANYKAGESQDEAPPRRSTSYPWRSLGRSYDPQMPITQPIPGDLTIEEISMEVTV